MDIKILRDIILVNELGGNRSFIYRFSDPDGPAGRSGYSFGLCQFDIANNPEAVLCLRECGFTTDEIAGLKAQTVNAAGLASKLAASRAVVDRWDDKQLTECLDHPVRLCRESGIVAGDEAMYHLADYHNQFYMSRGGKMHRYLCTLQRPVEPEDVLAFKLGLPWGKKRPDDVQRRYHNIAAIIGG